MSTRIHLLQLHSQILASRDYSYIDISMTLAKEILCLTRLVLEQKQCWKFRSGRFSDSGWENSDRSEAGEKNKVLSVS